MTKSAVTEKLLNGKLHFCAVSAKGSNLKALRILRLSKNYGILIKKKYVATFQNGFGKIFVKVSCVSKWFELLCV